MSRRIIFESSAFADFNEWAKLDKKIYRKIVELIKDIDRSPFEGLGKPEPLKYELRSYLIQMMLKFTSAMAAPRLAPANSSPK